MKDVLKQLLAYNFHFGQYFGVDVLPRHFYSEIPNIKLLKRKESWKTPYTLYGVSGTDIETQLAFCRTTIESYGSKIYNLKDVYNEACVDNGAPGFGPIEAEFLHAIVCVQKPAQIIQVGCGVSTAICLRAAREIGLVTKMICIDPFPNEFLLKMSRTGQIDLIAKPVEDLDPRIIQTLGSGDIFFVDSTHCLGPAGEVTRLILEFLPRLRKGVLVHFHDIYFPYDYQSDLLTTALFFHHESALLHAFLAFNNRFKIELCFSMLHHYVVSRLHELFPSYTLREFNCGLLSRPGHFPSSIYLRIVSD